MLILIENLSNCAYYPGAKPGRKHALNNQYALNSELRLLTRVYSMLVQLPKNLSQNEGCKTSAIKEICECAFACGSFSMCYTFSFVLYTHVLHYQLFPQ